MTDLKDYEPTPYLKLEGWDDKFVDLEKAKIIDTLNRDIRNMNIQKFKVLKDAMKKFLKQNGPEYKYFENKIKIADNVRDGYYVHNVEYRLKNITEMEKKKTSEQEVIKKKNDEIALIVEATAYLIEHGKKIGVDFKPEDAVSYANDLAFRIGVEKLEAEGGYIDFDGNNCSDAWDGDNHCEGWDMESHRCQCGNRRVGWEEGWSHSFKNPDVRAAAH